MVGLYLPRLLSSDEWSIRKACTIAEVVGNLCHNKSAAYLSDFLTTIPFPLTKQFSSWRLAWFMICTDRKKEVYCLTHYRKICCVPIFLSSLPIIIAIKDSESRLRYPPPCMQPTYTEHLYNTAQEFLLVSCLVETAPALCFCQADLKLIFAMHTP